MVEHFLGKEEVVSPILTRGSQSPLDAVLGIHIHIVLVLTAVSGRNTDEARKRNDYAVR